jgi:hypothetical protein
MIFCFKNQSVIEPVFKEGDFSFIESKTLKLSLEHDYKYILPELMKIDIEKTNNYIDRNSFDNPRPNIWDTPPGDIWFNIVHVAYPFHSKESYKYNIKCMNYIRRYSWDHFVINYQQNKLPFTFKKL